jgi:hypothetical protein
MFFLLVGVLWCDPADDDGMFNLPLLVSPLVAQWVGVEPKYLDFAIPVPEMQ